MNLITEDQARAITGGRLPHVPIEYERACKDLALCQTLDEAKYFSDKADALAAWAKIYQNDQAGLESKRLKLHAYRRMAQIAEELRPSRLGAISGKAKGSGTPRGSVSLMKDAGLPQHAADAARAILKIPEAKFNEIIRSPRPPAPSALLPKVRAGTTDEWREFSNSPNCAMGFRTFCRRNPATNMARALTQSEATKAKEILRDIAEWVDAFDAALRSPPSGGVK